MSDIVTLAVEIGGSGARSAFVSGKIIEGLENMSGGHLAPEVLVQRIADRAAARGVDVIVVSTSGFVNRQGVIERSTNTHFPPNLPLAQMIIVASGRPACVKNDLHVAGIGSAVVFHDLADSRYNCVNLGGGLGQCACSRNEVMGPCEFGHSRVTDKDDAPSCACGKCGCAESFIGGEALKSAVLNDSIAAKDPGIPDNVHPCAFLDERFLAGDSWAHVIYWRFAKATGIYLANFQLAIPAPVYTLRGSVAQKSLRIPKVMEWIKKRMLDELPAKSWMPEFRFIPPPQNGLPKDYDAFWGAGMIGERMLSSMS
jgi:predicted NBD/HSP70 family sugar kinase